MRLERNNSEGSIDNIRTAVFYNYSGKVLFPPTIKSSGMGIDLSRVPKGNLFQYRSSANSLDDKEFKSYEYNLFPPTGKYGDFNIMDLYCDDTRSLVGTNPDDIEKSSLYAIPTIFANGKADLDKKGYFRVKTLSSGDTIYQFSAPAGCYKIELFDIEITPEIGTTIDMNQGELVLVSACEWTEVASLTTKNLPVASIYFGPESNNSFNEGDFYYDGIKPSVLVQGKIEDYRALLDELTCNKVVTLVSSSTGEAKNLLINTSQTAAYDSKEVFRNLNTIALRCDEWMATRDTINQVGVRKGSLYDITSGTLLGNVKVGNSPILNRKRSKSDKLFSVNHTYSKGDVVVVSLRDNDTNTYVSLTDNNKGNNPVMSPEWISSAKFDNTFSTVIKILIEPLGAGKTNIKYFTKNSGLKTFKFKAGLGYEFSKKAELSNSETNLILKDEKNPEKEYDYEFVSTDEKEFNHTITLSEAGLKKVLETKTVVIKPVRLAKKVSFQFYNATDQKIYNLANASKDEIGSSVFNVGGTGIVLGSVQAADIKFYVGSNLTNHWELMRTGVTGNKSFTFDVSTLESSPEMYITGIQADYVYSDGTKETVSLEKNKAGHYIDNTKAAEVTYTYLVGKRAYDCKVFFNVTQFEVDNACPVSFYRGQASFKFYRISGNGEPTITVSDNTCSVVVTPDTIPGVYVATISGIKEPIEIHLV